MATVFRRKLKAAGTFVPQKGDIIDEEGNLRAKMWSSTLRVGGKQKVIALSESKSEAIRLLGPMIEQQKQLSGKQAPGESMSFLRLQQIMIEESEEKLRPATIKKNRRALREALLAVPITKASEFTPGWLERVKKAWVQKGTVSVDPSSKIASGIAEECNRRIRAIKSMARAMTKKRFEEEGPTVLPKMDWQNVDPFSIFREVDKDVKFFEVGETDKLEAGCSGNDTMLTLHMIGLEAGLRVGEVRHLWWENLVFDAGRYGVIQVRAKSWVNEAGKSCYWTPKSAQRAKSSKERDIPMTPKLRAYLLGVKARAVSKWVLADTVGNGFGGRKVGHVSTEDGLSHSYGRIVKQLGLNQGRRCVHALRHSFAVNYMRKGGNIYRLKELLGHSTITTTEIYAKFGPQQSDPVLEREMPLVMAEQQVTATA